METINWTPLTSGACEGAVHPPVKRSSPVRLLGSTKGLVQIPAYHQHAVSTWANDFPSLSLSFFLLFNIHFFYLAVSGLNCNMQGFVGSCGILRCSTRTL